MEIHSGLRSSAARRSQKRFHADFPQIQMEKAWEPVLNHNLQLYSFPPVDSISLLDFENLAIERLKVLKAVECAGQCYQKGTGGEYSAYLENEFRNKLNFKIGTKLTSVERPASAEEMEERRRDHMSHFILRLAFCKSHDQTQWFLQQEMDLFKHRFSLETKKSITAFLKLNGLAYESVEGKDLDPDLLQNISDAAGLTPAAVKSSDIFEAPFTDALELVRNRKVFLQNGIVYVLRNDLVVLVAGKFRRELSHSLSIASKYFGFIQEQDRLLPILKRLTNKAYVGKDYSVSAHSQISPDMIDSLAETSFPLCMRQLHQNLKKNHHLKHGGRMQYGLFLKGIGLSLNDAMTFWRSQFTKIMDPDKFEKQYAYNIRHNYGKEGKRADYTPYSCSKIILSNKPGPQDSHGCPFQETDPVLLRQQLEALKISSQDCDKIVTMSKNKQFDRACTRFFECTHQIPENGLQQVITHPNHYFEESRKWASGEKTITESVPTVNSQMFESESSMTDRTEEDEDTELASMAEEVEQIERNE